MYLAFIFCTFAVVSAAGLYLEKLTWDVVFGFSAAMLATLIVVKALGWNLLIAAGVCVLLDAILILKVFGQDIALPPSAGRWWIK